MECWVWWGRLKNPRYTGQNFVLYMRRGLQVLRSSIFIFVGEFRRDFVSKFHPTDLTRLMFSVLASDKPRPPRNENSAAA